MVELFKCEMANNAAGVPVFRLSWKWITGNGAQHTAQVLYRAIFENEILEYSLFDRDAIMSHISDEINAGTIGRCLKDTARYKIKSYSLNDGASTSFTKDIEIDNFDCVYFFCMVDSAGNIRDRWIRKAASQTQVKYIPKTKGFFSSKRQVISLAAADSRRIILQSGYADNYSYSLLPAGYKEYYLKPDTPGFRLIYLSELINI